MEQNIFDKLGEEALAKQKKERRDYILKVIPTGLWTAATIFTAANAFNGGNGFYIITGLLSIVGALAFAIKTFVK